jgi:hypothetical protein
MAVLALNAAAEIKQKGGFDEPPFCVAIPVILTAQA